MRICIDTNILAYAEGLNKELNQTRQRETIKLLDNLSPEIVVIPAQVLGELFRVLTGKAKMSVVDARAAVMQWADSYETVDTPWTAFQSAFDLTTTSSFQIWDALIMSIAAENRCRMLLSEDMQHNLYIVASPLLIPIRSRLTPCLLRC